jgi:hypothetical protein
MRLGTQIKNNFYDEGHLKINGALIFTNEIKRRLQSDGN